MQIRLEILSGKGDVRAAAEAEELATLVYTQKYRKGDKIRFIPSEPGFYELLLEDALPAALVYVEKQTVFSIPFGIMERVGYPPRAFGKTQHLLTARAANPAIISARRNLALNPLDQHGETGMFPHACANVETRGEALFAARNAIDGIYANAGHYPYPFQS